MNQTIFLVTRSADIAACFPAFNALRLHVTQDAFLARVRRQMSQSCRFLTLDLAASA